MMNPLLIQMSLLATAAASLITTNTSPGRPIALIQEPEENYYLVHRTPVSITCRASLAPEIVFTCMGSQIPQSSVEVEDVSEIDPDLIQAQIRVTADDVRHYEVNGPFWCTCAAVDMDGQVVATSRRGYVYQAYLNKFTSHPKSVTATVGENVELPCTAPQANPAATIVWRKDKKRLTTHGNQHYEVTSQGLTIKSVTKEDAGSYQCVARNLVGRQESEAAQVTVTALEELAEPKITINESGAANKADSELQKPRSTRQSIRTSFTQEPLERYYTTPDKPAYIVCGVFAGDMITFKCNGKRTKKEDSQTLLQGLDNSNNKIIQVQLRVNYTEVKASLANSPVGHEYRCTCVAWYRNPDSETQTWLSRESNPELGVVSLAYLESAFQQEPSDITATVGSDVSVVCEPPNGQPDPWVYWYKDGERVNPRSSNKYIINSKGHLIINNVEIEDSGLYKCVAENIAKSLESRQAQLTVTNDVPITTQQPKIDINGIPTFPDVIPSSPVFLTDFQPNNTLNKNGFKVMICAVVSADLLSIDCGGKRLPKEDYDTDTIVHKETAKKLIYAKTLVTEQKLAESPDGYFCQCTAWVLTEKKTWTTLLSTKGFVFPASELGFYLDPDFIANPSDTEAHVDEAVELECRPPRGYPPPLVTWTKDGALVDTELDENYVILDGGSLAIETVLASDEGEYVCVASNEANTVKSDPAFLRVIGKPESVTSATEAATSTQEGAQPVESDTFPWPAPSFILEPEADSYIVGDQAANISCAAVSVKILVFVCNGEVLEETARVNALGQGAVLNNTLFINREEVEALVGDNSYVCVCRAFAQEPQGLDPVQQTFVDSSPSEIYIAYLEDTFQQEPSDVEASYLARLELPCQPPNGLPDPRVYWQKDGERLFINERIVTEDSGDLIIADFRAVDEGQYLCVAENVAGSRTSQVAQVTLTASVSPIVESSAEAGEERPTSTEPVGFLDSGAPYISKDLHTTYYLVNNIPPTIICEAHKVDSVTFQCGNQTVDNVEVKERLASSTSPDGQLVMIKVLEASFSVSKYQVEQFGPGKDYICQCFARYQDPDTGETKELPSTKATVEVAYLTKDFVQEPKDRTINKGSYLLLTCLPPLGNPKPKVSWTKDGEPFKELPQSETGLIFPEVQLEHTGDYVCVAENEAGIRQSRPAMIDVTEEDLSSEEENADRETTPGEEMDTDEPSQDSTETVITIKVEDSKTTEGNEDVDQPERETDDEDESSQTANIAASKDGSGSASTSCLSLVLLTAALLLTLAPQTLRR